MQAPWAAAGPLGDSRFAGLSSSDGSDARSSPAHSILLRPGAVPALSSRDLLVRMAALGKGVPFLYLPKPQHVLILSGEKLPADGTVLEGWGSLDESMLSGEPLPVEKVAGSHVSAGTLNSSGSFIMRVGGTGGESQRVRQGFLLDLADHSFE